jgi:hypothetical protein
MNHSLRIKPTSINGKDENPKVVENRLAEEADRWDPPGLADLGECQVGPPLVARLLMFSRIFLTWFLYRIYFLVRYVDHL